jgi:geranylgeranyl pyrophosphate synthase
MSRERISQLLFLIGRAAKLAAEGELLEVALSKRGDIKEEEYLEVIRGKTGALFAASAASGAVAAAAEQQLVDRMYDFGLALGTAFQIGDDMLDLLGDTQHTGKPAFKDIENNAGNIVIVHTLAHANPMQRNVINSLLFKKWFTSIESEKLLQTLTELGSFNYASSLLHAEIAKCKAVLNLLPGSPAKDALVELIRTVEVRRE